MSSSWTLISRFCCLTLAGIAGAALLSCHKPPSIVQRTAKHAVIIVVDSLRKDVLSIKGPKYSPTAMIEKLAGKSTRFQHAYAQGTTTEASFMSLMSSTHVRTHGVDFPLGHKMPKQGICNRSDLRLLPEVLQAHGFETEAVVGTHRLSTKAGFPRGFHSWNRQDQQTITKMHTPTAWRSRSLSDEWVQKQAEAALERWAGSRKRHFLYLHLAGPDIPYAPPPVARLFMGIGTFENPLTAESIKQITARKESAEKDEIRFAYLAEVWEADARIYKILHKLKKLDLMKETVVVITGNHGVRFFSPETTGVEEIDANVPLILHIPEEAPRQIPWPVSHIDIAPTLLRLLSVDALPERWQGTDLFMKTREAVFTERLGELAVRLDATHKIIVTSSREIRRLNDVPLPEAETLSRMKDVYRDWLDETPKGGIDENRSPSGICKDGV